MYDRTMKFISGKCKKTNEVWRGQQGQDYYFKYIHEVNRNRYGMKMFTPQHIDDPEPDPLELGFIPLK